jgi:hypothetical protein
VVRRIGVRAMLIASLGGGVALCWALTSSIANDSRAVHVASANADMQMHGSPNLKYPRWETYPRWE